MNSVIRYSHSNRTHLLSELKEFLLFPSVSAQPKHVEAVKDCANWLAHHLQRIGLRRVEILATPQHPIVYAESKKLVHRPTVLIYGYYGVQPPDPLEEWDSPPFQPVVRGENLYGRGASDDKGQLFAHIKAKEAYLQTQDSLPVNVKCLFDGEEEIGSPSLPRFLATNRYMLNTDVVVISDMRMVAANRPAITYAMRGALGLKLEVKGPKENLHSGLFGGAAHNPIQVLSKLIGTLQDAKGKIAIPGFYDRVRLWSDDGRDYMASVGPTDATLRHNAKVQQGWGETGYSAYERTTIRPALTVTGFFGGYQGKGAKSIIPSRAIAKLEFRLVPNQFPSEIEQLIRAYIKRVSPPTVEVKVRTLVCSAAVAALRKGFGTKPVFLRSGGTIPVVNMLQRELGVLIVLIVFALPSDNIHAPNEKFHLPTFFKGIKTSIYFLSEIAARIKSGNQIPDEKDDLELMI